MSHRGDGEGQKQGQLRAKPGKGVSVCQIFCCCRDCRDCKGKPSPGLSVHSAARAFEYEPRSNDSALLLFQEVGVVSLLVTLYSRHPSICKPNICRPCQCRVGKVGRLLYSSSLSDNIKSRMTSGFFVSHSAHHLTVVRLLDHSLKTMMAAAVFRVVRSTHLVPRSILDGLRSDQKKSFLALLSSAEN
jgi:hypothetical protein